MAINLISVKCPECNATLNIEEGRQQAFCSYCGAKVIINNDNEYVYRKIDEAEIKKAEAEREVRIRELEMEKTKLQQSNAIRKPIIYIWIVLSLIIICICIFNMVFRGDEGFLDGFFMLFYLGGPVVGGGGYLIFKIMPEKEVERDIRRSGGIRFPKSLAPFEEQNYMYVQETLINAGFSNVNCVNMHDVTLGLLQKPNKVESVSVNGKVIRSSGKIYMPDVPIVITYHGR